MCTLQNPWPRQQLESLAIITSARWRQWPPKLGRHENQTWARLHLKAPRHPQPPRLMSLLDQPQALQNTGVSEPKQMPPTLPVAFLQVSFAAFWIQVHGKLAGAYGSI